ncbi:MAG: hypothetical protein ICV66_14335 [Chitinophagaceae bacterium]|nr:hypothetical protein [Chitinophagaceae bacterium]
MVTLRNGKQILPNWTLRFDEVSNNVYKVALNDTFGRQAATTDHDLERAVRTCEGYAFDIEKQISKDWSRFMYEYSMLKLQDVVTFSNGDPKNAYGSWGIKVKDKILTYDGRDDVLIARDGNADAFDYKATPLKDISFEKFIEYIDFVKQETQPTTSAL